MIRLGMVPRKFRFAAVSLAAISLLLPASGQASELLGGLDLDLAASGVSAELALPSPGASEADTRAANLAAWRGRFCLTPGCKRTPAARVADSLAFGAAIFGVAWLSRRRAFQRG